MVNADIEIKESRQGVKRITRYATFYYIIGIKSPYPRHLLQADDISPYPRYSLSADNLSPYFIFQG